MNEGWYPLADDYYVADSEAAQRPVRQGDLMVPPTETPLGGKKPWVACLVIHPSCELGSKKYPPDPQVIRVLRLRSASQTTQPDIVLGMREVQGESRVASANTFFLPPISPLDEPMFADFHQPARIPRTDLSADRRIAALSHDARLYFIRRKLYWEQRWLIELKDVLGYERARISNDSAFVGDKPAWAVADSA